MHDGHTLHQIRQLAYITWPRVGHKSADGRRIEAHRAPLGIFQPSDQFIEKERNILATLAQRGHFNRKHIQPIVQILTKRTFVDHFFQIAVSRSQNAHIGLYRARTAHPFEALLLQHAQQFDLHGQRHITDFVEEQRTTLSELKAPDTSRNRTGECALFMAEQLTFQQVGRNRTTIDGHKRFACTAGVGMQIARHHFFAST